ncbi:MAG TPA: hypothetical protein VIV60_16245 [Polyangiaceae bacterium]
MRCSNLLGTTILVCTIASPLRVHAEGDHKEECSLAYESAQVSRRDGNLLAAKTKLQYCSGVQCPNVMHGDCQRWLSEIEASIPTVVFHVELKTKSNPDAARVSLDGAQSTALDGRAIAVNPGRHQATISASGFSSVTREFTILEGEKLRREAFVLLPQATGHHPRDPAQDSGKSSVREPSKTGLMLPLVMASAVAVIGGVGTAYFGLNARDKEHNLGACSPNCDREAVDSTKRDYLLANASMGLAGAGLLTAGVLLVVELKTSKHSANQARLGFAAQPNLPVALSLSGKF